MATVARFLYNGLVVPAARATLPIVARFHSRLAEVLAERRGALERWREAAQRTAGRTPRIWFHASSAGEALQARPLVEAVRSERSEAAIFFSWWSPSAGRFARGWEVDHADVLPLDIAGSTRRLVDSIAPDALVLVGGETWPNLVWSTDAAGASVAQACCRLAGGSRRLRWPALSITRDLYRRLAAVAAVREADAARVHALGVEPARVAVTGDTRVDATLERAGRARGAATPWRPTSGPVVVAGSTHARDETALLPALATLRRRHASLVAIMAPHDPTPAAMAALEARARENGLATCRLSSLPEAGEAEVVIVDRVGVLYELYALADVAYVGGAFDRSVHNTMEPAAFGVPIVVGPQPGPFHEVAELAAAGALVTADSAPELARALELWLGDPAARMRAGSAARATLERHRGATARTIEFLRARGLPV
jgi:3-deoxy-D-manno-octulosonic-acid transferase